jgi:hypothetical protein
MRKRYRGLSYGSPLALSDEMILATLDGQKTLTIRAISHKETEKGVKELESWPYTFNESKKEWVKLPGPYGEIGDYLWVRESYRVRSGKTEYRLDSDPEKQTPNVDWMPVVGMPEECSRMCLQVTGYRFVQGVQTLKVLDLYHDGFSSELEGKRGKADIRNQFARYWDTRYRDAADKWASNPSVWVTEFRLLTSEESKALKKAKDFLK